MFVYVYKYSNDLIDACGVLTCLHYTFISPLDKYLNWNSSINYI